MLVFHTLEPIYFNDSKVLILGSMPSLKSRELGFYYSHPTNKFWTTLEKVYDTKIGSSKEEKIMFLKKIKLPYLTFYKAAKFLHLVIVQ